MKKLILSVTSWAYPCHAHVHSPPPPPGFLFSALSLAPMFLATLLSPLIWQCCLRRHKTLNLVLGQALLYYR